MSESGNSQEPAATHEQVGGESSAEGTAQGTVRRGGLIVAGLIIASLLWYLVADRFTPVTDQARIQGYVVGVAPQVAGVVTEVWVKNNQEVAAGDPLFRIDPSQYEIALAKARSDLENTQRQVDAGDAGVDAARANQRSAEANLVKAEKDTRRMEALRTEDPGTISKRRLEVSQATLEQARASVVAAKAQVQQAIEQKGGDNNADNTQLKVAQSAVAKAELDLERTVVKASSRGIITDLKADVGRYSAAGSPVMTLVALHDVWVRVEYTENNLGHLEVGTPVEIVFDVMPGRVYAGEVSSIGLGVSFEQSSTPGVLPSIDNDRDWLRQSQRFPVNVRFKVSRDSELAPRLRIGGQATVMAFSGDSVVLRWLGKGYIRMVSILSYAY